jgi:hypothetical protein
MTTIKDNQMSETEALRADLELTRRHLAETVQELSRQLNVPRRMKESAGNAGHRAVQAAGEVRERAVQVAGEARQRAVQVAGGAGQRAVQVAGEAGQRVKEVPAMSRRHPKATAAAGALAVGVGAAAWIAGRNK